RVTDPDTSKIGKTGGLVLSISGIARDKFTSVYWGPQDLGAIRHSLEGPLTTDRIMTFNPGLSNLSSATGIWLGSSPSIYDPGDSITRFQLITGSQMVLASSVGISNADVVMPVLNVGFGANLVFQTNIIGTGTYVPSNEYFTGYQPKPGPLPGYILSSFTDAFWYTAPDVEVASQSYLSSYCLGTYASIQVTTSNHGPGPATQINVDIALPPEWELVSYGSSPCGLPDCFDPNTGDWTVGDLAEGFGSNLSLTVKLNSPGEASMTATKTQYQVDSLTANDSVLQILDTNFCSLLPMIIR
ncbi:MAG: DUF11 domain-containing protein, partial [Anaerolineaceae bacterium]|nr:DUF11 domain-containing protein [Anaerolineaceae bacterium]